jgi:2-polyprenyl-3-methyl-5-hydroxy-6-metoxy-1,4-benzoquinol methylase
MHDNVMVNNSRYSADFDLIMHDYCLKKFKSRIKDRRCLEMGCYHGRMTKKLSALAASLVAVDSDLSCLEYSKEYCGEQFNINFTQSAFESYEKYNEVDVIYFSHALEHVENDAELMRHIFDNMQVGADLITIVPNALSLSRQIAVNMGLLSSVYDVTDYERTIGHHRTYDLQSLENLFSNIGFSIKDRGGLMPKIFANYQYDAAISAAIIDARYLDGLFSLSDKYPEICSSIYTVCTKEM